MRLSRSGWLSVRSGLVVAVVAVAAGVAVVVVGAGAPAGGADESVESAVAGSDRAESVLVARLSAGALGGELAEVQQTLDALDDAVGDHDLESRHVIVGLDAVVYETLGDVEAAAQDLADAAGVAAVERDVAVAAHERVPNDPRWGDQWGLQRVEAPAAWEMTTGEEAVSVAVLDTGVDAGHPDLAGNVDGVVDVGNFSGDGVPTDTHDRHGHGTASAGVAAAVADNAAGIAGACWDCGILPVKVLGDDGGGVASDVAAGLVYAVEAGADVASLSLGAANATNLLRDAVAYATQRGVPVIASAGNYGDDAEVYPAAFDDAVGVVATDRGDDRYGFSSFGDWAEIAAPGCNPATDLADGYKQYCGTSSAAPVVAGIVGLARSVDETVGVDQVRQALAAGAVDVDGAAWGRVDAAATLAALAEVDDPDLGDALDDALDDPVGDLDDELDNRTDLDDPGEDHDGDPGVRAHRIAGVDRFATAARLSLEAFGDDGGLLSGLLEGVVGGSGPDRVYLTSGLTFADALAAGPVAGTDPAPVLLAARDTLPRSTVDELARLDPDEVVAVGGAHALSDATVAAAGDAGAAATSRIAGRDRFATAAALAVHAFDDPDVAYVATGLGYADALAGVPAAVVDQAPMLLTAPDHVPDVVTEALAELDPDRVVVLGGASAIAEPVAATLGQHTGAQVERLAGATRFDTATAIANDRFDDAVDTVHLATGTDFPDALAAGPVAGSANGPLLLVTRDDLPAATAGQLDRLNPETTVTMGGTSVVSDDVQADAAAASTTHDA